MIPEPFRNEYSEQEYEQLRQEILNNPEEFIQEFQKSIQWIDLHRDELHSLSTPQERRQRIFTLLDQRSSGSTNYRGMEE